MRNIGCGWWEWFFKTIIVSSSCPLQIIRDIACKWNYEIPDIHFRRQFIMMFIWSDNNKSTKNKQYNWYWLLSLPINHIQNFGTLIILQIWNSVYTNFWNRNTWFGNKFPITVTVLKCKIRQPENQIVDKWTTKKDQKQTNKKNYVDTKDTKAELNIQNK